MRVTKAAAAGILGLAGLLTAGCATNAEAQERVLIRNPGARIIPQAPQTTDPNERLDAKFWSGAVFFHWYGMDDDGLPNGQFYSPWLPLEGRDKWDGSEEFYARQTLLYTYAGFNMIPFQDLATRKEDQKNHLTAIKRLQNINERKELMQTMEQEYGIDVFKGVPAEQLVMPKISVFVDMGTFDDPGREKDFTKQQEKDLFYSLISQGYKEILETLGPEGIAWHNGRALTNIWYIPGAETAKKGFFTEMSNRLKEELGFGAHFSTHHAWRDAKPDEINYLFSGSTAKIEWNEKGNVDLLVGYWPPDNAPHEYWVARDEGRTLRQGLEAVLEKFRTPCTEKPRILWIESYNEYTEGSGLYPAKCGQMPADAYSGDPERSICLDTPCVAKRDASWFDAWGDCADPRAPFLYLDMMREYNTEFMNYRPRPAEWLSCRE